MGFKTVLRAFRANFKSGITDYGISNLVTQKTSFYGENSNADPTCDRLGNQFIRNWDNPIVFRNWSDPQNPDSHYTLGSQFQCYATNASTVNIGTASGIGDNKNLAVLRLTAVSGDPAVLWSAAPCYLQAWRGSMPGNVGSILLGSWPVPVVPECLNLSFDIPLPLNFIAGPGQKSAFGFSSTRDTFTAGPTGSINFCVAPWYMNI